MSYIVVADWFNKLSSAAIFSMGTSEGGMGVVALTGVPGPVPACNPCPYQPHDAPALW